MYNKKAFKVDRVAFDQSPKNYFMKDETEISYQDYYRIEKKKEIYRTDQPLLIYRDEGNNVVSLVP